MLGPSGALKTSLNYELDAYLEARREFPDNLPVLKTSEGIYYPFKKDLLRRKVLYSESSKSMINPVEFPLSRIREIADENRKGLKPSLHRGTTSQGGTGICSPDHHADIMNITGGNHQKPGKSKYRNRQSLADYLGAYRSNSCFFWQNLLAKRTF
ncbi:MAG: hypothetical protein ACLFM7_03775 [Bacteroidales bacterium]